MICIYSKDNTEYSKNGDAVLIPISCKVTMTINGSWYLELEHPYDPEGRYKYIIEGAVLRVDLKCIRELTTVQQRFRIYQYTKNMHSVTAIAFPIAMESTYDSPIDNLVINNKTGAEAMALLQAYSEKYTLSTDITATKSTSFANTNINSAIASGDDNCFISVWGGEIVYDNLKYTVKNSLGNANSGLEVRYGRNLSAIERKTDDSGLTTRIKPISKDGIRLNGTGYVNSPRIDDYPIIHTRYMTAPYELVEDDVSSPSATAVASRTAQAAVSSATSTLSESSYSTALGAGYQPEYIKSIKDDIVSAVQTMALANVISTSLYNYLSKTIASAMSWLGNLEQPAWDWNGSYESGWWYGNDDGYARNEYVRIGKKWSYFGDNGYWQEPKDDEDDWDWYQVAGEEGKRYGNFKKYFAHNTYVYITMDGTLTKYWFDSDGWYDSEKTDESDWSWHGSGTAEDPWWFGDPDAEGDEKKYAHSTWLFIDGTYYFFDEYGYYDGSTKFDDYQWDWVESGENFWFGNAEDDTFGATWVTSQWLKINGSWYYFDSDGYVISENSSKSAAVTIFTSGMASLGTTVDTQAAALYNVLYGLMTDYSNKQYAEGVDVPAITITVNMVDLSKTTEYAGYASLETVKLGDGVTVNDDEHNISLTSRIIGLTYDCVRDYNAEIVIGSPSKTVSDVLGNAGGTPVAGGFDTSAIEAQIEALQDNMMTDFIFNGGSIVSGGVGRFNITKGSHIQLAQSGNNLQISTDASKVQANPTGTASGNMTKVAIDDVIYNLPGGSGGLTYWTESQDTIEQTQSVAYSGGWTCDAAYYCDEIFNYSFLWGIGTEAAKIIKKNGNPACAAYCKINYQSGAEYGFLTCATTAEDACLHWYYRGDMRVESVNVNGVTLYRNEMRTVCGDVLADGGQINHSGFTLVYMGEYSSMEAAWLDMLEKSHFATQEVDYTGIGVDTQSGYCFWGGQGMQIGSSQITCTPEDMPFNVTNDGVVNAQDYKIKGVSIDTLRNMEIDNNSIVDPTTKTAEFFTGTNMEFDNGSLNCTLPLTVVNGKLCSVYDDGE